MNCTSIQTFRDGGTLEVKTSEGTFYLDQRIGTTSLGQWYRDAHPSKPEARRCTPDEVRRLQALVAHLARFAVSAMRKGCRWDRYCGEALLPGETDEPAGADEQEYARYVTATALAKEPILTREQWRATRTACWCGHAECWCLGRPAAEVARAFARGTAP